MGLCRACLQLLVCPSVLVLVSCFSCAATVHTISLGDIRYAPTWWVLALFLGFVNFWSNAPKCRLWGGGGVCVYFLKSVRKGRFRNVWVGGGGHIFEQTELQIGRCTRWSNVRGTTDYSESESPSLLRPATRAGTTATVHAGRFSPNQHQCMWPRTHAVKPSWGALYDPKIALQKNGLCGGQNLVFLVGACRLLRTGCPRPFCLLGDLSRVTRTQSAPPERALFRTNGFCGASWDATARGVNLYADMQTISAPSAHRIRCALSHPLFSTSPKKIWLVKGNGQQFQMAP